MRLASKGKSAPLDTVIRFSVSAFARYILCTKAKDALGENHALSSLTRASINSKRRLLADKEYSGLVFVDRFNKN